MTARSTVAIGATVVLAAGVVTGAAIGFGGAGPAPDGPVPPPATARVGRQTMVDTDEETGLLGYGMTTVLAGRLPGVVTAVPVSGDVVVRGRPVYRVDDRPVILLYGRVPAYRALGPGVRGHDVRQLETNLRALGYGGFTVDGTYSAATATAVRRWQHELGLPRTGRIELGRVLFAPGPVRIDSVAAGIGESVGGGREVLRYTGTGRQVTVRLDVSRQRLARAGVHVRVRMPGGADVAGRLERVHSLVEEATSPDSPPQTRLEALVSLGDPRVAAGIEAAAVTVVFTAAEHRDVLAVPVAALIALAGGGYGVELVDGPGTHVTGVTTGLFADGLVEVSGDGLRAGAVVGMPR